MEVISVQIEDGVAKVYTHESIPINKHGNYGSSCAARGIANSICATLILHEEFGIKKVKLCEDICGLIPNIDTSEPLEVDMTWIKEK